MSASPIDSLLRAQGIEPGAKCCATVSIAAVASTALFIIGCVGAAGAFPGSTIGWVTIGLGGGSYALSLSLGNLQKRKFDVITGGLVATALVVVGALGGAGILTAQQVGWGIVGTTLANIPISCIRSSFLQSQVRR